METDERIKRILATTDFYLSRFGLTQVGIFQLPTTDLDSSWYYVFINTLMVTLRRWNFMPYYFWIRDIPGNRYILFLWVNGYFRVDISEITPIVERVWKVHSPNPVSALGSFALSMESTAEDKARFLQTANSVITQSGTFFSPSWHRHTFGGSQIR